MLKKIGRVIVGAILVVAHCLIGGAAFADSYTQDGKPCPPECVSDSMEIVTWYPSPYNEYEELRLYPKFSVDESQCNSVDKLGLMYYNKDEQALKVCWQDPSDLSYSWEKIVLGEGGWKLLGNDIYYNSGNVGIGTSSPGYKLDIQGGQINASGGLCMGGNCKTSWPTTSGISGTGLPIASAGNLKGYTSATIDGATYVVPYYEYIATLVGNSHNTRECTSQNGTVVTDSDGNSFCKFSASSCPLGWTKYQNWTETISSTYCSTPYHYWANSSVIEECGFEGADSGCTCSNWPSEYRCSWHRTNCCASCGKGGTGACSCIASSQVVKIGCY